MVLAMVGQPPPYLFYHSACPVAKGWEGRSWTRSDSLNISKVKRQIRNKGKERRGENSEQMTAGKDLLTLGKDRTLCSLVSRMAKSNPETERRLS